jgi:Family of unknown function (DUF5670)
MNFLQDSATMLVNTQPVASAGKARFGHAGAERCHGWALPRPQAARRRRRKETPMLWTIFVILLVLWLLGLVTSYTLGGFIHILLVIAVVVIVIRLIQGRRPIP